MEKKLLIIAGILLIGISLVSSIPQFLIFQGDVKLDGRPVKEGTIVNFSIGGTELDSDFTDENGEYDVFIQGFEEFFGEPINITINNSETEQKIDYVYPQDVFLNLSTLTENALKITENFPIENIIKVRRARILEFNISTETGYDDIVNHTWFLDEEVSKFFDDTDSSSFIYEIKNNDTGTHNITIFATDGFLTIFKEWTLIIERPGTENFDGATTDFDSLGLGELFNVPDVILEKIQAGKIEFLGSLNLSGVTDLNNRVKIERGIVAVDSSFYPQLNKPARITLTGVSYNTIPEIFFTEGFTTNPLLINKECNFCNIISFTNFPTTNGEIIFEVEHFSSFKAGNSGNKHNLTLFDDLDTCRAGVQGDLILEIKDPDEGDEFNPGDEIKVKVDVENNADEKKKIIVEASLYNIDEDDEIENIDDDKKIKDDDEEKFELILDVPDDFEDDKYIVFVKAYEDGDEEAQCAEGAIDIDLEREKHEVIIKEFSVNPKEVLAGRSLDIEIKVENIGESDEDIYIVFEIKELDVSTESEIFELEEFGGDDLIKKIFSIKIPDDTKEGEYDLIARIVFDDGEDDEREETISVLEKIPIQMGTIFLNAKEPLKIEKKEALILEKKPLEMEKKGRDAIIPLFVPIALGIGIVILIILIIVVALRKKR